MVGNIKDLVAQEVTHPDAYKAAMQVRVSPENGWDDHVMRVVEVEVDGFTPKHNHPSPHINFFIEGNGELMIDGQINKVEPGSFAFVPENALHQFRNKGENIFKFICIVPSKGHY